MGIRSHSQSCTIVGAGLSGLVAARTLRERGWAVTVLDEGRGVGGRLATLLIGDGTFDHGAQFFTVREERFREIVDGWLERGVVAEWSRGFARPDGVYAPDGYPRYRGSAGMAAIAQHLAEGLGVRLGRRATAIGTGPEGWIVTTEAGESVSGDALLLACPVPQALALMDAGGVDLPDDARRSLKSIRYEPCLSVMALLAGPSAVPEPGGVQYSGANGSGEPLWWLGDNQRKGISSGPALTLHGGPAFSRAHWDAPDAGVAAALLAAAGEFVGSPVREVRVSRWRYSTPADAYPERCLVASTSPPLVFAGDAFGGPRVEGAALSGLAAAEALMEMIRDPGEQ